ncbi:MAG: hypothetical protein HKN28_10985 [Alphaproteobacteria bacterium]|nr:hypothetical protein [Alphaproteobacteria bacterium]
MNTETRYLFETDFDNPEANEKQVRKYSEEDIVAARQEALDAARAELHSFEEKRGADILAEISAKIETLSAQRAEDLQSTTESAVDIAVLMCRKVLPTLAAKNALTEIEGHIARALADVHGEPRIVVRVAEEHVAALQPRIDSFATSLDSKIVLLADDQLAPTDCHVLWADGGSERDVQRTWSEINKVADQITDAGIGLQPTEAIGEPTPESTSQEPELSNNTNGIDQTPQVIY